MNTAHVYAEITKTEKQDDGTLLVRGVATSPALDIDQQVCDPDWLSKAMPAWFVTGGNIREQHANIAAGVATEYAEKDGGVHEIAALVVDPVSVKKVEKKVLKGFSIGIRGPRVVSDKGAPGGRIVDGQIVEVSLVDRPANPECTLTLAKAAGPGMELTADRFDEERQLVRVEELVDKAPDGDLTKGGDVVEIGDEAAAETAAAGSGEPAAASDEAPETAPADTGTGAGSGEPAPVSPETTAEPAGDPTPTVAGGLNLDEATGPAETDVETDVEAAEKAAETLAAKLGMTPEDARAALATIVKTAVADELRKRAYSSDERKQMAGQGQAMPGGGFPIKTVKDLKNAIQSIGRAKDPAAAKKHIIDRAKALGREDLIPDAWKGSDKASGVEEMAHDEATLRAVRDGLLALIIAEAQEAMRGEREEDDIDRLNMALAWFLAWWDSEAYEGEAPLSQDVKAGDPDLTKTAGTDAPAGTETTVPADDAETVKAADTNKAADAEALSELRRELEETRARLAEVEKAAAPGGPVRTRITTAQRTATTETDQLHALRTKAARLRATAATIAQRDIAAAAEQQAAGIEAQIKALTAATPA